MSDNIFMNWLETELAMKEREDMVKRKKKEIEVPTITDLQLVLTNRVKTLVSDINDNATSGIWEFGAPNGVFVQSQGLYSQPENDYSINDFWNVQKDSTLFYLLQEFSLNSNQISMLNAHAKMNKIRAKKHFEMAHKDRNWRKLSERKIDEINNPAKYEK